MSTSRRADESGFTLIEVLIALTIMTIIVAAIGGAIITALNNQSTASNQVSDSSNANLTSAVYVRDVESASSVTINPAVTAPPPCGTGGTFLLGLTLPLSGGGSSVVTYWQAPLTGNLTRKYCGPIPSTLTLARSAAQATGLTVTVVASSAKQAAAAAGWTSASGISSVTIHAQESSTNFTFDLAAAPRVIIRSPGPIGGNDNPALPPLFLLGSAAGSLRCGGSPGGVINVTGSAFLDSTTNGSGSLVGNGALHASSQIYTADPTPSGAINPGAGNASPSPMNVPGLPPGTTAADPYNDPSDPNNPPLVPPSGAGMTTFTGTTFSGGPGIYTNTVNLTGGNTTLPSGIYILQNGLTMSGNAVLQSGPGGVLIYVSGGIFNVSGGATLTLSPLTPSYSTTAPKLVIWQDKSDTNTMTLSGNSSVSSNLSGGTVYAPSATVTDSGTAGFTVGSIVASGLACNGTGQITITG